MTRGSRSVDLRDEKSIRMRDEGLPVWDVGRFQVSPVRHAQYDRHGARKVLKYGLELPSFTVLTDIAVGDHDIIVDYLDSENTSRQETTKIIATDKCLTSGLTVPIADGDLDMVYIIESPMQFINFSGLMNDECQFTTAIHIDSIDSGINLQSFGLTHTEAVFESHPVGFPLDTFRVRLDGNGDPIGDAFLTLATNDYLLDGEQKMVFVLIESVGGLSPEVIQF